MPLQENTNYYYSPAHHSPKLRAFSDKVLEIEEDYSLAISDPASTEESLSIRINDLNVRAHDAHTRYLEPAVERYAAAKNWCLLPHYKMNKELWSIANNELEQKGKEKKPTSELAEPLRQCTKLKPFNTDFRGKDRKIVWKDEATGEEQCHWLGGDPHQVMMNVYKLRCHPRYCGVRDENNRCPHEFIYVKNEIPPEFEDGRGWVHGNVFEVGHKGSWPGLFDFNDKKEWVRVATGEVHTDN